MKGLGITNPFTVQSDKGQEIAGRIRGAAGLPVPRVATNHCPQQNPRTAVEESEATSSRQPIAGRVRDVYYPDGETYKREELFRLLQIFRLDSPDLVSSIPIITEIHCDLRTVGRPRRHGIRTGSNFLGCLGFHIEDP